MERRALIQWLVATAGLTYVELTAGACHYAVERLKRAEL